MSRLSDDEKRVFTDRIAELEEYRQLYHLECTKVMSREAIIEQLSETELAKDVTRLEAELSAAKTHISEITETIKSQREENTLLAEHNRALQKDNSLLVDVAMGRKDVRDLDDALLGGDDAKD